LRLGPFIAAEKANYFTGGGPSVTRSKRIDRDQLFARLDDIKSRTKSSIEISRRLIDQSFLRFKATHRNLYAAQQSQEQLNSLPQKKDPAGASEEPSNLARTTERREAVHSAALGENSTCEHCEGVLLNNKCYRVRTQDQELVLLDMVVCYACNLEAKNLGLETDELQATAESELISQNNQVLPLAYLVSGPGCASHADPKTKCAYGEIIRCNRPNI
jgi:RNase P subunit RPR2